MKKKFLFLIIILLMFAGGCSNKGGVDSERDAKKTVYKKSQLEEGLYIKKGERDEYIKLMSKGVEFNKNTTRSPTLSGSYQFIWFANSDPLIPEYTREDIIIFKSEKALPTDLELHELDDYGYTLGATIYKDVQTDTWRISKDKYKQLCEGSSFNQEFKTSKNNESTRITDIGEKKITETEVTSIGSIKGLKKDEEYKIGVYNGTMYSHFIAKCDTRIFVDDITRITPLKDLKFTKEGYVVIDIPEEVADGYYYLDMIGMFKLNRSS
ncbi:MAG: hypothetical protein ACRCU3_02695 [Eubacteriaceae bacterium]